MHAQRPAAAPAASGPRLAAAPGRLATPAARPPSSPLQVRSDAAAAKASLAKLESAWLPRWAEQATRQAAARVGPALDQAKQYAAQVRPCPGHPCALSLAGNACARGLAQGHTPA